MTRTPIDIGALVPASNEGLASPGKSPRIRKALAVTTAVSATRVKPGSALYLDKDSYKRHLDGLMAQGLEHADAVDTLKVGLRQANGIPVPLALTMPA